LDAARAGFDDEFLYQEIPRGIEERTIPTRQLLREEAVVAFAEWSALGDKIEY